VRVVVVIPCLDDAGFLAACLDSLAHQTRMPDEVLVVDNGSSDGSQDVARRARVSLQHEPVRGVWPAAARGYDIAARTADVIARVDADSIPPADWVARVVAAFDADPTLDALTGPGDFYGGNAVTRYIAEHWYVGAIPALVGPFLGHTVLFGSNFAMRPRLWLALRGEVHRWDPKVHDDFEMSLRFPRGTVAVWDQNLRMAVSARPFASLAAFAARIRKALVTFKVTWPLWAPWVTRGWGLRGVASGARPANLGPVRLARIPCAGRWPPRRR
jgi:glycosyltransferase involved in cell wall biosynthesis